MLEYTITRLHRKNLSIYVRADGSVEARAPMNLSKSAIDSFVRQNEDKLREYISIQLERNAKRDNFKIDIGSRVLFMGKELEVRDGGGNIEIRDDGIYVQRFNARAQLIALYKAYAKRIFTEKAQKYSKIMRLYPSAVKINSAKTRWGSCSAKGSINLSWRLIMASEVTVDYVIIHELAHLKHMNHSPEFWALVEAYAPNHRECRRELNALSERLRVEDWD